MFREHSLGNKRNDKWYLLDITNKNKEACES